MFVPQLSTLDVKSKQNTQLVLLWEDFTWQYF